MKQNLLKLKALLVVLMMAVGFGQAWADDVTGTITFGSNDVKINAASVTGDDDLNNTWQITTVGTTSYTAKTAYYQVGSSNNPASSITFTTTLPAEQTITSMSAKFGGFKNTAGTITMKVGDTTVGTGSLSATSDVEVSNTSEASGNVLTVTVTGISKGVKVYYISYTYSEGSTPTVHTLTYSATNGTIAGVDAGSNAVASGASVAENATVTLTATPSDGYEFSSWEVSGTGSTLSSSSTNPTTFTMGTADATVTANFVKSSTVATPAFTVAEGTYNAVQSVEINCGTDDATIYYTIDGTDPTTSSSVYSSAISVTQTTTIKAFAVKDGMTNSAIASATYTLKCVAPSFNPAAGSVGYGTEIALSTTTEDATMYYTTNGDNPTSSSSVYDPSNKPTVRDCQTFKAIATKKGWSDSDVSSATYNINIPVVNAANVNLTCDDISGSISYTITNPASGALTAAITAGNEGSWLSLGTIDASTVAFSCSANEGDADRTATITLTYTYDTNKTVTKEVTVTQAHPVVDYVTLPFAWEGGSSSSLTSTPGVTASGLGSDYGQTHDPYNVKFDHTNDYIQIKTNERPEYVTVGIKMVGGNSDSKITVQESADGETYTKVGNDLSISGAQNTILSLTSTTAFASTTRYIRLSFTKGSNVGIGPITVTKYVPKYTITIDNPTGGTITVKDSKENLVSSGNKFEENAVLTLSAEASTGYTFSTWTKTAGTFGSDATTADNTFTMPAAAATIGATFTKNSYTLSLSESSSGTFTVKVDNETWDGESKIPYNSNVSITANPNSGKTFASWDTTLESYDATTNPLIFNMPAGDVEIEASFADASIEYDIVVDDDVTGGNIEADVEKAKAGDTVTLTATPSSGYVFDSWNVQDESENTVTVTNNQFTMPASDVTVTATFLPVYTVNYYIGGVKNTTTRISGEALNLDTPSTGFAGWSTANSATSPVFMANDAAVTSNLDVYATFISSYSVEYRLVEADQADWRGDYLIAYSSTIFADGRVGKHDGTDPIGGAGVNVNPDNKLSGKIVDVEWGDTYNVTLEAIDNSDLSDGYVMKGKDNYYIYQTSNANGITSSANKATAANYPITVTYTSSSNVKLCLGGPAAGAVFRYNENGYFRYYKNGGQSDVYLYKRTLTANYSLDVHETVTVSTAGYATYASDNDLDFTDSNIKAYIAKAKNDGSGVTFERKYKIPAGTGVLLYKDGGATEYIPVTTESTDDVTYNVFVRGTGENVASVVGNMYNYILNKVDNVVGFYKAAGQKVAKNRAYIQVESASLAKDFISMPGFDDSTTGVTEVNGSGLMVNGPVYDLQGRRVEKPGKGLYIVNGKKVLKY